MVKPHKIHKKKTGFFRFKQNSGGYLITNDLGCFAQLREEEFRAFVGGTLSKQSRLYAELSRNFFINDKRTAGTASLRYQSRYQYLCKGPTLHIIVVTLRCNYACVYCQANRKSEAMTQYDMTRETAKNVVDRIFESPERTLTIEFQGGEPLLNWPVVRFIVSYSRDKELETGKKVHMTMVSNLSLMSEEKFAFLMEKDVHLCTSLDGPEHIHNKNRPCQKLNSYRATTEWIKKLREKEHQRHATGDKKYPHKLGALLTITKSSLGHLKEIIDEYLRYDFRVIHLRRLSFLGFSGGSAREVIGYTAEEFIAAWKKAMDYIIDLNLKGTIFSERGTLIFLHKMLTPVDPGYMDVRSPCGAAVGQLAYNYDGKVYTCDEARMLKEDVFLLGNVNTESYQQIVSSPKVKTVLVASTLENFSCDECVYKAYCGICPVLNYFLHGSIFPTINATDGCKIHTAMLDYIFEKRQDKDIADIFNMWVRTFPFL